ncbi:MAG: OmpA family protein [Gemmatimonadales bacterium]
MNAEPSGSVANGGTPVTEFDALRRLLVGPEQHRIEELSEELQSREITSEQLAEKLPEAIALRGRRDDHLGRALGPTIETALRESIRRDPEEVATAIFPVLGPAIRKAIAETMAGLVRSINTAVEQSLSLNGLKWRVESWRTGVPYPEIVIKHALVYRVEEVFFVHAETGLLLEHVSAPGLKVPDADLISSMMSAIRDFVHDSFRPAEGATLRTFSVGDHTIQVEAGPRALLAVVIRGQAPDAVLRRQQDTLEVLHLQFAGQLADFSGDAAPFEPSRPLLEDCLETVLSTDTAVAKRRFAWLKWALPLLLIVAAIAAFWVRSSMRWNRGLASLRAEPGIVVVDASRGWRNWAISGLRDPVARDPSAVLASAGLLPSRLSGHWEQYLSLDPVIVATRAQHSLDSLGGIVETRRILFDAGSAELNPLAIATLAGIATLVQELDRAGAAAGRSVRLELTGRTDPTGLDETNTALAQRRIEPVAEGLESVGIPSSRIIRNAVASDNPLPAADPSERARINRSVSFKARVSAAPSTPREP